MTKALAVAPQPEEQPRALTPAQEHTSYIRKRLMERLPNILPNGMSPERFEAVTIQAIAKNPDLMNAEPGSIIMACLEAAQLGLEPTGSLSRAWLVPFKENGVPKAQLMIGYQGLRDLIIRSGAVSKIVARVVYEGDLFEVEYGYGEEIRHTPAFQTTDPAKVTYAYCIATLRNGERVFDVMTREEVERIRARSRQANKGPWVSDWPEMAKKTVTRRLAKSLPMTAEILDAIAKDDDREFSPTAGGGESATTRTSAVKQLLASREKATETAQDDLSAPEGTSAQETSAPPESAAQQATEAVAADEVCGATSDPALGDVETCVLKPGHAHANGKPSPHESAAGTKFPNKS